MHYISFVTPSLLFSFHQCPSSPFPLQLLFSRDEVTIAFPCDSELSLLLSLIICLIFISQSTVSCIIRATMPVYTCADLLKTCTLILFYFQSIRLSGCGIGHVTDIFFFLKHQTYFNYFVTKTLPKIYICLETTRN